MGTQVARHNSLQKGTFRKIINIKKNDFISNYKVIINALLESKCVKPFKTLEHYYDVKLTEILIMGTKRMENKRAELELKSIRGNQITYKLDEFFSIVRTCPVEYKLHLRNCASDDYNEEIIIIEINFV